jgi:nucleoside-diphosphate-sugar epimerase
MPERVLVTGADGFVGRHLVAAVEERGLETVRFSLCDGDIAREKLTFAGVRHVFHLAARMFVPDSWADPLPFYETNVLGTANVLEFCRRAKASLTLVSSYVYGTVRRLPVDEDHPTEAYNPYCHTKLLAEDLCRFYERVYSVRAVIVRPFNLYGRGQDERFLVPVLVRQALDPAQETFQVLDQRPRRDHLHVKDLVSLLLKTLGQAGATYNAGSGSSVSIQDLVAILNRLTGRDKPLVSTGAPRPNEVMDVYADVSKALRELGWSPQISLENGLRDLIEAQQGVHQS